MQVPETGSSDRPFGLNLIGSTQLMVGVPFPAERR